jgi:hypothetical protein
MSIFSPALEVVMNAEEIGRKSKLGQLDKAVLSGEGNRPLLLRGARPGGLVTVPARQVERPHTPSSRMLPSVIGSIGKSKRLP